VSGGLGRRTSVWPRVMLAFSATLTLLAIAGGLAAGSATARTRRVHGLIASPKPGSRPRSPVRVVLRVGDKFLSGAVRVSLNGENISQYFRIVHHGRRVSEVSPSQGIRYGRNVLTVTVVPQRGPRRRQRVRFTVSRRLPLAGAGPDVRVPIGSTVTLDGSRSMSRSFGLRNARAGRSRLRLRWRLVSRPRRSRARLRASAQGMSSALTLRRATGGPGHPALRPDRIGTYRVRLTVSDGRTSKSDFVDVQATYETSEVPIDTAVDGTGSGGQMQGIAIGYHPALQGYRQPNAAAGEQFYPLGAGDSAQIVVLDRQTLAPVSSASYPAGSGFVAQAQSALSGLPATDLALVTTWPSAAWASSGSNGDGLIVQQLTAAKGPLAGIGASPITAVDAANGMAMEDSTVTWVGVQGFPAGSDWERIGGGNYGTGGPSGSVGGGLNGFLTFDPAGNYTYIAKAGAPLDLGPNSASTATMSVGSQTYSASLPAGSLGGFAVMVLHAGTLAPYNVSNPSQPGPSTPLVFSTRNADGTANYGASGKTYVGQGGFNGMSLDLEGLQYDKVGEPLVVLIRSIGAPFPEEGLQPENNYQGSYDPVLAAAVDRLAFDVASFGGHYEWLIRMATPVAYADQSYSEVGRNHTGEGDVTVADTGSGMSPAPTSNELSGRLERNNVSLFAPVQTSNSASVVNPVASIVTSEPVAWPDTKNPARVLAVQCLGDAVGLGPDPRYEYWNLETNPSDWSQKFTELVSLTLPGAQAQQGCSALTQSAFAAVRHELGQEFEWMNKVESYVANLAAPFGYSGSYAAFTAVDSATQAVKGALPLPQGSGSENGFSITDSILGIAGELLGAASFEVSGPVVGVTGYLFGLWGEFSGDSSDSAAPTFAQRNTIDAAGAQIGDAVAARLQAVSAGSQAMTDAIASDYARLKQVGTYEGCVPSGPNDPNCPPGWEITQKGVTATKDAFILSARRSAWAGLLPAAWPTVLYTNSNPNSYNGTFEGPQDQLGGVGCDYASPFQYPYNGTYSPLLPGQAFLRYDFLSDPQSSEGSNTKFMVMTNGNFKGASTQFSFPPSSLFTTTTTPAINQLFSPVNPEDVDSGPLGMDEYQLFADNWHGGPYAPSSGPVRENWVGC
jgi:hypothetical protein